MVDIGPFQGIVGVGWGLSRGPWWFVGDPRGPGGVNYEGEGAGNVPDLFGGGEIQANGIPIILSDEPGDVAIINILTIANTYKVSGIGAGDERSWVIIEFAPDGNPRGQTIEDLLDGRRLIISLSFPIEDGPSHLFGGDLFPTGTDGWYNGPTLSGIIGGPYFVDIRPYKPEED